MASDQRSDDLVVAPEAFAAAPPEVATGGLLLPRRPVRDRCRLCGETAPLTREHIPPASAGNRATGITHTIEEWLGRASLDDLPGGSTEQGGVWGRTLCADCNSCTDRYAGEYRGWAARAARILLEDLPPAHELDAQPVSKALRVQFQRVRPGAFARQVLSLMASISGPWDLAGRYDGIRAAVLEGQPGRLPDGMTLSMTFYLGPSALIAGPFMAVDRDTGAWKWSLVIAFPPLAFEMVLASSGDDVSQLCGIHEFLEVEPAVVGDVELDLFVAFGHTALPTDWRTRAQVEQRLSLEGIPDVA